MNTTHGLTLQPTRHALRTILDKGFTGEQILTAFSTPDEVYPSKSHPGQYRVTGQGVCLVGEPRGKNFVLVTVYADGVLTPPREDQLSTTEGARYAARYQKGLGRG